MRRVLSPLFIVTLCHGCTHVSLRNNTLKQESSLTDLQYRQVLDNIAMFCANPGALPYFALSSGGTAQVSDDGSISQGFTWDATGFSSPALNLSGTRNLTEAWTLAPVLDPDKLDRMRCAYQVLIGADSSECRPDCQSCKSRLCDVLGPDICDDSKLMCFIPQGWYCVGKKHDVPTDASYYGHYGETYVWVNHQGVGGLTRFTLTILNLATADPGSRKVVRTYGSSKDLEANNPSKIEVTSEEPVVDCTKCGAAAPAKHAQPSRNIPRLNPSIQLVPR